MENEAKNTRIWHKVYIKTIIESSHDWYKDNSSDFDGEYKKVEKAWHFSGRNTGIVAYLAATCIKNKPAFTI